MSLMVIIISITSPSLSSASSPASSPSSSIALRMIFGTWRSYFISWQIFENKVWCPVSKKIRRYFHFLLSLAYPIDRLDWALFSVVILFHHWFPLLEKAGIRAFILPRNFSAVLIIFTGRDGEPPPFPAGRGVHPWFKCSNVLYIRLDRQAFTRSSVPKRTTMTTFQRRKTHKLGISQLWVWWVDARVGPSMWV